MNMQPREADKCLTESEAVSRVYNRQSGSVKPQLTGEKKVVGPHVLYELYYSDGTYGCYHYVCKYCGLEYHDEEAFVSVACGEFLPDPIDSQLQTST